MTNEDLRSRNGRTLIFTLSLLQPNHTIQRELLTDKIISIYPSLKCENSFIILFFVFLPMTYPLRHSNNFLIHTVLSEKLFYENLMRIKEYVIVSAVKIVL